MDLLSLIVGNSPTTKKGKASIKKQTKDEKNHKRSDFEEKFKEKVNKIFVPDENFQKTKIDKAIGTNDHVNEGQSSVNTGTDNTIVLNDTQVNLLTEKVIERIQKRFDGTFPKVGARVSEMKEELKDMKDTLKHLKQSIVEETERDNSEK